MVANRYVTSTRPWLILAAGVFPFLAIPLMINAGLAAYSKNNALRVATAIVFGAYLFIVSPVDAVVGCAPESHQDEITIVASNLLAGDGADAEAIVDLAEATDPDIMVWSEATSSTLERLGPELLHKFPYQSQLLLSDAEQNGSTILSRWPLQNVRLEPVDVPSVSATVESPYGDIDVYAIHTQAPVHPFLGGVWAKQLANLRGVPVTNPTIMAGDFNATEDHKLFRQLLGEGWADVHDDKGCGPDNTFPSSRPQNGLDLSLPVMRLDHALLSDHFETLSVEPLKLTGSDHLALRTTVRLRSEPS